MYSIELHELPEGDWAAHCLQAGRGARGRDRAEALALIARGLHESAPERSGKAASRDRLFTLPRPGHAPFPGIRRL